jgi:hypothetical protein
VHAKDASADHCSDGQKLEGIGDGFPEANSELALALVVESVYFVEFAALVVPAQEEEVERVLELVGQQ